MKTKLQSRSSWSLLARFGAPSLAALLLLASPEPVLAGGGGSSVGPVPNETSGSDDVESVPLVVANRPTGFEIEVGSWQIEELLRGVRGQGRVELRATRPGKVAARFSGSFQIQMDTERLRDRSMRIRYHGARENARILQRDGRTVLLQR